MTTTWAGIATFRQSLIGSAVALVLAYLFLFLDMSRLPGPYDEGLVLAAAMRVGAGQIPPRDFYANYGPGQFYVLAGLFRAFGTSIFIERLYDLLVRALAVSAVFAITSFYCRQWIASCAAAVAAMWFVAVRVTPAAAVVPVSLLAMLSSSLLPAVFLRGVSVKRIFLAGLLAGLAAVFRYDVGVALLGVHICILAIATRFRSEGFLAGLRPILSTCCFYLLGFAAITAPPFLYYLSVAPLSPLIHDVLVYPFKYYPHARRLPLSTNLGVYLPLLVALLSLYIVLAHREKILRASPNGQDDFNHPEWRPFVFTFAFLTAMMYLKGYVRISPVQMYLPSICSLPLIGVLFQRRLSFSRSIRFSITGLACLFFFIAIGSSWRETKHLYAQKLSVVASLLSSVTPSGIDAPSTWCKTESPLTKGMCFYPEQDRIQTIEFIAARTAASQKLFVGVPRHDKIYANDNLIYFATQRLPATKWSHFDPDLQNSSGIQAQMVDELERNTPPYIVLDSEFERFHEPNDSSKSTGVTLLDDYIHSRYQPVATFGFLSVWQLKGLD